MIRWLRQEDGEGEFDSKFFHNEDGDRLSVYANNNSSDFIECAEQCVDSFNHLPEATIYEICEKLMACAEESEGLNEDFEVPPLDNPRDILNYCWFVALYADMENKDDTIAYAVEGEGEWGENIGFYIDHDDVIYVGADYLEYMKNR